MTRKKKRKPCSFCRGTGRLSVEYPPIVEVGFRMHTTVDFQCTSCLGSGRTADTTRQAHAIRRWKCA